MKRTGSLVVFHNFSALIILSIFEITVRASSWPGYLQQFCSNSAFSAALLRISPDNRTPGIHPGKLLGCRLIIPGIQSFQQRGTLKGAGPRLNVTPSNWFCASLTLTSR
jgi:hypothetical protein